MQLRMVEMLQAVFENEVCDGDDTVLVTLCDFCMDQYEGLCKPLPEVPAEEYCEMCGHSEAQEYAR